MRLWQSEFHARLTYQKPTIHKFRNHLACSNCKTIRSNEASFVQEFSYNCHTGPPPQNVSQPRIQPLPKYFARPMSWLDPKTEFPLCILYNKCRTTNSKIRISQSSRMQHLLNHARHCIKNKSECVAVDTIDKPTTLLKLFVFTLNSKALNNYMNCCMNCNASKYL